MAVQKTDLALIAEIKKGVAGSFEELVERYSDKAYNLAQRLTRNQADAEEVVQDVFVTVFRKIDGFEGKSSFSSWLYRVTMNAALMKLRACRKYNNPSIDEMQPQIRTAIVERSVLQPALDRNVHQKHVMQVLERAISRLPEDFRPVFILRDIDGLTNREVAKLLGISVPAVKSRLHRSRLILRKRLSALLREGANQGDGFCQRLIGNM